MQEETGFWARILVQTGTPLFSPTSTSFEALVKGYPLVCRLDPDSVPAKHRTRPKFLSALENPTLRAAWHAPSHVLWRPGCCCAALDARRRARCQRAHVRPSLLAAPARFPPAVTSTPPAVHVTNHSGRDESASLLFRRLSGCHACAETSASQPLDSAARVLLFDTTSATAWLNWHTR